MRLHYHLINIILTFIIEKVNGNMRRKKKMLSEKFQMALWRVLARKTTYLNSDKKVNFGA